jgi:hypothetical protein
LEKRKRKQKGGKHLGAEATDFEVEKEKRGKKHGGAKEPTPRTLRWKKTKENKKKKEKKGRENTWAPKPRTLR